MNLYSFKGGFPKPLPSGLVSKTPDELSELGYSGPYTAPAYSPRTQKLTWDGSTWFVVDLTDAEIEAQTNKKLLERADFITFTAKLTGTTLYAELKTAASTSLPINVLCTELISQLTDAKLGHADLTALNALLVELDQELAFPDPLKQELWSLLNDCGLATLIIVPDFTPDTGTTEELEPDA